MYLCIIRVTARLLVGENRREQGYGSQDDRQQKMRERERLAAAVTALHAGYRSGEKPNHSDT